MTENDGVLVRLAELNTLVRSVHETVLALGLKSDTRDVEIGQLKTRLAVMESELRTVQGTLYKLLWLLAAQIVAGIGWYVKH